MSSGTALDGLVVDRFAIAVTGDETGGAVLHGGAGLDGAEVLRPAIWWISPTGEGAEQHVLPVDGALFNVQVWWTGTEVGVIGLPCPRWSSESSVPDIDEDGASSISMACGNDRYLIGAWNPEDASWREMDGPALNADDGVFIKDANGSRALVSAVTVEDGAPATRVATLNVVDLDGGEVHPLPVPPLGASDGVSAFTPCMSDRGTWGLLVWEEELPPGIEDGRWGEVTPVSAAPYPDLLQNLLLFSLEGDAWVPVTVSGDSSGAAVTPVCHDDGILTSSTEEASILVDDQGGEWRSLGDLPRGGEITTISSQGHGPALAIGLMPPPEGEPPDSPITSPLWVLRDSKWTPMGEIPYRSGWRGAVVGDRVISLLPVNGPTTQGSVRMVMS